MSLPVGASGTTPVRVGIVDDDPVLSRALARAVASAEGFVLAGTAASLDEARALVAHGLDVLLLDLGLPDGSGLTLVPEVPVGCKVLVVTVFGDGRTVVAAIEQGADGYLLKGTAPDEVLAGIRSVLAGGAPISPSVAGHILERVRGRARPAPTPDITLTPREVTVLEHLAKGLSLKEVAGVLGISFHTVNDHVKSIYRKLAVNTRTEAVYEAIAAGLIDVRS